MALYNNRKISWSSTNSFNPFSGKKWGQSKLRMSPELKLSLKVKILQYSIGFDMISSLYLLIRNLWSLLRMTSEIWDISRLQLKALNILEVIYDLLLCQLEFLTVIFQQVYLLVCFHLPQFALFIRDAIRKHFKM